MDLSFPHCEAATRFGHRGVRCLAQAILQSWHGANRPEVAIFYVIALVWFIQGRQNRWFAAANLTLFVAAFVPFFVSKGFAPRFAYFPSTFACVLLAAIMIQLIQTRLKIGIAALTALLLFNAAGMQNLIDQWRQAGQIAESIPDDLIRVAPQLASGSTIAISGVPAMYKHAYVYLTGLPRSVTYRYGRPMRTIQVQGPVCEVAADAHFRYVNGRLLEQHCAADPRSEGESRRAPSNRY